MEKKVSKAKKGLSINPGDLLRKRASGLNIEQNHKPIFQKNMSFDSPDVEKFFRMGHLEKQQVLNRLKQEEQQGVDYIKKLRRENAEKAAAEAADKALKAQQEAEAAASKAKE